MNKTEEALNLVDQILGECNCSYDPNKEMNQTDVAFQPDTLFDDPKRMVKDKTNDNPSLNPVPNTESFNDLISKATGQLAKGGMGKFITSHDNRTINQIEGKSKKISTKPENNKNLMARNESIFKELNKVMKEDDESISASKVADEMNKQEKSKPTIANNNKNKIAEGLADWIANKKKEVNSGKAKGGLMGSISARKKALDDAMKN